MQIFRGIWFEEEFENKVQEVSVAAQRLGAQTGYGEGYAAHAAGKALEEGLYGGNPLKTLGDKLQSLDEMTFPVIDDIKALAAEIDPLASLKQVFDESDRLGAEEAGAEKAKNGEGLSGAGGSNVE